jgi:hypothetical protein
MTMIRNNWAKLAGAMSVMVLAVFALYACISAWGLTPPGLSIAVTATNQVSITVTNGVTNGLYQIYYTEFLSTNPDWVLFTNGSAGQTNFTATTTNTTSGFFEAAYNPSYVPPTITVIIQSPANGALIY